MTHPFVEEGAAGEGHLETVPGDVGVVSPGLHLTVLVVSRGHHAAAGQPVLDPVHPHTEALLPGPPVVMDQPRLDHLLHGEQEPGLVEEDHHTTDRLHSQQDQDQGYEESHPAPGHLYSTVQYSQYSTVQYSTVQYSSRLE